MKKTGESLKQPRSERGAVFAIVLVILAILAAVIMGLNRDVQLDLAITRNLKSQNDALSWAESGLSVTEEMIAYAVDTRGDDAGTNQTMNLANTTYMVQNTGNSLFLTNSTGVIGLSGGGNSLASVSVNFLGVRAEDGSSIIIAAGYEGVGKGAGAGATVALYYDLLSQANSTQGQGASTAAEIYRYIGGG